MRDLKQWQKKINPPPLSGAGVKHPKKIRRKGAPTWEKMPPRREKGCPHREKAFNLPHREKKGLSTEFFEGGASPILSPSPLSAGDHDPHLLYFVCLRKLEKNSTKLTKNTFFWFFHFTFGESGRHCIGRFS